MPLSKKQKNNNNKNRKVYAKLITLILTTWEEKIANRSHNFRDPIILRLNNE